jgi:hypothetical protein
LDICLMVFFLSYPLGEGTIAQISRSMCHCGLKLQADKETGARRGESVPAGGEGRVLPVELEQQHILELKHSGEHRPTRRICSSTHVSPLHPLCLTPFLFHPASVLLETRQTQIPEVIFPSRPFQCIMYSSANRRI